MKLIIAEKPSLARNIVSGIGKMDKKEGFYINADYIVTWAFGHLFSLADIESYTPTQGGPSTTSPASPKALNSSLEKARIKRGST